MFRRCSALTVLLFASGAVVAEAAAPTVLVLPFEGRGEAANDWGLILQLRAIGTLNALGGIHELHPKQLNRVLEHHHARLSKLDQVEARRQLATLLGAGWILAGTFEQGAGGATIAFEVRSRDGSKAGSGQTKGKTLAEALGPFSVEVGAALKRLGAHPGGAFDPAKVTPASQRQDALLEYAACYRVIIQQPIGITNPALLDADRLEEAIRRCEQAAQKDEGLEDAHAALGFLHALKDSRAAAERHLARVRGSERFLPMYWIGKFWVVSRHHDIDLAIETLENAIARQPGFLLARGYLGEALVALERFEEARAVFSAYLEAVPNQPWVTAQIGHVTAKLGKLDEAKKRTQEALRIAPFDPELMLEMASRHIDAQEYGEAITILKRISSNEARGEVHLRLGYAYLLEGDYPSAERELRTAIRKATALSEWRTRGRARYNLAKMWMRSGMPEKALTELREAIAEGYRDLGIFEGDPDFAHLLRVEAIDVVVKAPAPQNQDLPKYVSPFPLNPENANIEGVGKRRPKARKETVILRF